MTTDQFTLDGITYRAAPPAFPWSANKCTGCAFVATRSVTSCETHPTSCIGSLRVDFRDVIWVKA